MNTDPAFLKVSTPASTSWRRPPVTRYVIPIPDADCLGKRHGKLPNVSVTLNTFLPEALGKIFPEKMHPETDPEYAPFEPMDSDPRLPSKKAPDHAPTMLVKLGVAL